MGCFDKQPLYPFFTSTSNKLCCSKHGTWPCYHMLIRRMGLPGKTALFFVVFISLSKIHHAIVSTALQPYYYVLISRNGAAWKNSPCFYSMSDPL